MNRLITYLTFNGNCREAMSFYKDCFGGKLNFLTVGEAPDSDKLPEHMKNYILQATLKKENLLLMATDLVGDEEVKKGNSVSILIECSSKKEMEIFYKKLSLNGSATHPIKTTFWGTLFGSLIDKYNNSWLLHCE